MLGSIAHRAGLGVDVSYMEDATHKVVMNRQELRQGAPDYAWVSAKEKQLFGQYESAKVTVKQAESTVKDADKKLTELQGKLNAARKAKIAAKKNAAELQTAEERITELTQAIQVATANKDNTAKTRDESITQRGKDKSAWIAELDANEPACVKNFREALKGHAMVGQFFDPWYMDSNTRDKHAASPNEQCTDNETLHAHHLHVTIEEPNILA